MALFERHFRSENYTSQWRPKAARFDLNRRGSPAAAVAKVVADRGKK
jgi:hypothetical protein